MRTRHEAVDCDAQCWVFVRGLHVMVMFLCALGTVAEHGIDRYVICGKKIRNGNLTAS